MVGRVQQANLALKCAPVPVVAAPAGKPWALVRTGAACARIEAPAELYLGFADSAAGLIPAGGATKELLLRLGDARRAFELIFASSISASADHARELGLIRETDCTTMNPERQLAGAKAAALALVRGFRPARPREDIRVGGEGLFASIKLSAWLAFEAGRISNHDLAIAEKLAYVLCGGRLSAPQTVTENYLLELEREAFLSLCGSLQTQDRIEHLLKIGKPLRN